VLIKSGRVIHRADYHRVMLDEAVAADFDWA
jgi:hypothetical protein